MERNALWISLIAVYFYFSDWCMVVGNSYAKAKATDRHKTGLFAVEQYDACLVTCHLLWFLLDV